MALSTTPTGMALDELTALVARKVMTTRRSIQPFVEFSAILTELIRTWDTPGCRLVCAGHVTPDVEIAANQADVELIEKLGPSTFSTDSQGAVETVRSPRDLIYVANPNRVTGTGFSLSQLEQLARAVPQGMLFIDEYYFDHYGISGFPLVDLLTNVIILRSFTASFGITSSDAGFLLASPANIETVQNSCLNQPISATVRKTMFATLIDVEALVSHLQVIHDESLRLATELNRLKVQCLLTSTDFLLLRVADPERVGNFLAGYRTPVDNLHGYPQLENYLRYQVQSPYSNDKLLEAFKKMPVEYYRMKTLDRRTVKLRRTGEVSPSEKSNKFAPVAPMSEATVAMPPRWVKNRKQVAEKE